MSSLTESMIIYDRNDTWSTRGLVGILSSLTDKFFYAPVVSHCIVLKNDSEKVIVECSLFAETLGLLVLFSIILL